MSEGQRFQRRLIPFRHRGFSLAAPADRLSDDLLAFCQNLRRYDDGSWRQRPGTSAYVSGAIADLITHSCKRLNNPTAGATFSYFHLLGASTKLYAENAAHTAFSSLLTGFSGDPLCLVDERPFQSPYPFVYIGDRAKLAKVGEVAGALVGYNWGIAPPTAAPSVSLGAPVYLVISDFDATTESAVAWANAGNAAAPTIVARITAALAITYILYDSGSSGWASVVPATFTADIQPGMRLAFSVNPETTRVHSVYEQAASTTIGSIAYDSGATGDCSITPVATMRDLQRDMLLRLNTGGGTAENVRVKSVTSSPDGVVTSFRCSTVNTHAVAETIDGLRSFRCYLTNAHTAADTLTGNCFSVVFTGSGTGSVSHTLARDLSRTSSSGRPITDDDEFHISLWLDDPSQLSEGTIFFDVDSATNDCAHNAFYRAFRPSDFQPVVAGTQTTITATRTALGRRILEARAQAHFVSRNGESFTLPDLGDEFFTTDPLADGYDPSLDASSPVSDQTPLGTGQWYELRVKRSEFQRIGSDTVRGWRDVALFRIQLKTLGNCTLKIDSAWLGGSYGPDSADSDLSALPYYYATRFRSLITGAKSNFSPPTRAGVMPRRESVNIPTPTSSDAQVDIVDIVRFGGTVQNWKIIGSVTPGTTLVDSLPDTELTGLPALTLAGDFQPFPSIDLPRSGTCNVSGTTVTWATGAIFNTAWARGSDIVIGGVSHKLYAAPSSTTQLEIVASGGTQSGVSFTLPQPTLLGQPLPAVWGPAGGGLYGDVLFACGDPRQAGTLFFTNFSDPDSTLDTNSLDITSGSEQLQNGCVFRGRSYVFSNLAGYEITPRLGYGYKVLGDDFGSPFIAQKAMTRGLYTRWSFCTGDAIYFRASDGIYATNGAEEIRLSDDLGRLLPHDGVAGEAITLAGIAISPPDPAQSTSERLAWADGYLFYTFLDIAGARRTLVCNTRTRSWESYDSHAFGATFVYAEEGASVHQTLIGGADGRLYKPSLTATGDNGSAIVSKLVTRAEDFDDARQKKLYGDLILDAEGPGSVALGVTPYTDAFSSALAAQNYSFAARELKAFDLASGVGTLARSLGLLLSWSSALATPVALYSWEPSFLPKLEESFLRATDWTDCGTPGDKFFREVLIEADTLGVARTVKVQADGLDTSPLVTLTINHSGQLIKPYTIPTPFIAHMVRLLPTDSASWRDFLAKWTFDPYAEYDRTVTPWEDGGSPEMKFLQGLHLVADTAGAPVQVQIQGDEGAVLDTISVTRTGRSGKDFALVLPARTHMMRLVPLGNIRLFEWKWLWQPEPPLGRTWRTQSLTQGSGGFHHYRDLWLVHRSTSAFTFNLYGDGALVFTKSAIPASGASTAKKEHITLPAVKAKLFEWEAKVDDATDSLAVYETQIEALVKSWGEEGPYRTVRPFGAPAGEGALV